MNRYLLHTSALILVMAMMATPVSAVPLVYGGVTLGAANADQNDHFNPDNTFHIFFGLQTESYVTYELAVTRIFTNTPTQANNSKHYLDVLSATGMAHLPFKDSSLFARAGFGYYEYFNSNDKNQNIAVPTYGLGLDISISPRTSFRLEWQRYVDIEVNQSEFTIDTFRVGGFYYF